MELQALIVFLGLLIGDARVLSSLNQSKKEKLMDLEEQFPLIRLLIFRICIVNYTATKIVSYKNVKDF